MLTTKQCNDIYVNEYFYLAVQLRQKDCTPPKFDVAGIQTPWPLDSDRTFQVT